MHSWGTPAHRTLPPSARHRSWPTWPTSSSSPVRRVPVTTCSGRRSSSWWISSAVVLSSSLWSGEDPAPNLCPSQTWQEAVLTAICVPHPVPGPSGTSRTHLAQMERVRLSSQDLLCPQPLSHFQAPFSDPWMSPPSPPAAPPTCLLKVPLQASRPLETPRNVPPPSLSPSPHCLCTPLSGSEPGQAEAVSALLRHGKSPVLTQGSIWRCLWCCFLPGVGGTTSPLAGIPTLTPPCHHSEPQHSAPRLCPGRSSVTSISRASSPSSCRWLCPSSGSGCTR